MLHIPCVLLTVRIISALPSICSLSLGKSWILTCDAEKCWLRYNDIYDAKEIAGSSPLFTNGLCSNVYL